MKRRAEPKRELTHLAQRVFNTPLMISEHKAEVIVAALHQRLGIGSFERIDSTVLGAADMVALAGDARRNFDDWKLFHADGNVAVIPITGTLVHRFGHLDPYSGLTGYDGIARKFHAACADPEIKAIWFDIDSPGGEAAGNFALCEEIARYCDQPDAKPVWAYVNEQATSAAYAIASVCHRIYGPRTMIAGSISSYIMFTDWSKAADKAGLSVSIIRGAPRKGRMTGAEPLDDKARAKLQSMVDDVHDVFCELVAMGRSLSADAVDNLGGDLFGAVDALAHGLVDGVMSEAEAWELLQLELGRAA